ncbi:MAG: RecX family transcriptional regulator [Bacteroidales bacterium]|nr:RecX family transcriptional regulator [Bacteroidales bacterium]
MDGQQRKILARLQHGCARREYCSQDILQKARKALDGDEAGARALLDALEKDGFVDDARYAAAFAREKAGISGWGPAKIRFALRSKDIPPELVAAALDGIDMAQADARLQRLLSAKWKTLSGDPQAKLKLLRFALGRGFSYEAVRDAVDALVQGNQAI